MFQRAEVFAWFVAERISKAGGEGAAQGPRGAEYYVIRPNATSALRLWTVSNRPSQPTTSKRQTQNRHPSARRASIPSTKLRAPIPTRLASPKHHPPFFSSRSPLAVRWLVSGPSGVEENRLVFWNSSTALLSP